MKKQVGSLLFDKLNVFQIFGANTGVGKTVASIALSRHLHAKEGALLYLKPVQTGSGDSFDARHVKRHMWDARQKTLFSYGYPVSPHLAARYGSSKACDDDTILQAIHKELCAEAKQRTDWVLIETAGGVLSPAPSGSLQADLYRPLRLPVLLVGDSRLGGIGSTISAWESLRIRGFDVDGLILFKDEIYENSDYLIDHFRRQDHSMSVAVLDPPPPQCSDDTLDQFNMRRYYDKQTKSESLGTFKSDIHRKLEQRREKLNSLSERAHQSIWHPFLQHTERNPENILAIDSAYGDHFQAVVPSKDLGPVGTSILKPAFDGSASWWTQGLGHGNPELALTAAYAAGRYGHVMFANAAHEPAVALAETMLTRNNTMGQTNARNKKQTRAFYSDNGSTAMEVAVKMGLKAAAKRYGWGPEDRIEIVGLKDSYHGDTIGAMDCSEGNIYNEKVEWYSGRGHWLDYPRVAMKKGKWVVSPPAGTEDIYGPPQEFQELQDVFNISDRRETTKKYREVILKMLNHLVRQGHKLGALIMEPVILGAGGMNLVDPVFQYALYKAAVEVRQQKTPLEESTLETISAEEDEELEQNGLELDGRDWNGMPIITDEVFTGIYRLGHFRSSNMIGIVPDISVHAKLLTGGVVPLAVTLASESIYSAFLSNDKSDALLHGHSYTAHAIGCEVALKALNDYRTFDEDVAEGKAGTKVGRWTPYKRDWKAEGREFNGRSERLRFYNSRVWSLWSRGFVTELSHRDDIEGVFALGSVLAIELKDPEGGGYASKASIGIRDKLLEGIPGVNQAVHSRVLGNVLYFMASLTTTPETISAVQAQIEKALG
ncbi:pyridoxal phosphate-dependent transferase [Elsinoe ampelina]|uniref:Pyridoxal phosphate-dependent transferase n=1 Tax=Elsinoe ampelina TaxID=302913 RepID=A0A6A6G2H2_9PEZI|nr:pyridoxal phosphate-dependent transferase [Elsinoe ampelina]